MSHWIIEIKIHVYLLYALPDEFTDEPMWVLSISFNVVLHFRFWRIIFSLMATDKILTPDDLNEISVLRFKPPINEMTRSFYTCKSVFFLESTCKTH